MCLKPKSLGLGKWFSPRVSTCPASISPTFNPQRPHDVPGTGTKAETEVSLELQHNLMAGKILWSNVLSLPSVYRGGAREERRGRGQGEGELQS